MHPISEKECEASLRELHKLFPENLEAIQEEMAQQQPILFRYILAFEYDDILTEEDHDLVLFLGTLIWKIMTAGNNRIKRISKTKIKEAELKNLALFNNLKTDYDLLNMIDSILEAYNQQIVFVFILFSLMEDEIKELLKEKRDKDKLVYIENKIYMLLFLKTMIDCLDQ